MISSYAQKSTNTHSRNSAKLVTTICKRKMSQPNNFKCFYVVLLHYFYFWPKLEMSLVMIKSVTQSQRAYCSRTSEGVKINSNSFLFSIRNCVRVNKRLQIHTFTLYYLGGYNGQLWIKRDIIIHCLISSH